MGLGMNFPTLETRFAKDIELTLDASPGIFRMIHLEIEPVFSDSVRISHPHCMPIR